MDSPVHNQPNPDEPYIPPADELDTEELQETVNLLRRFHLGEPTATASTTLPDGAYLPLLLNNFRNLHRFRYEYPLLLSPAEDGELAAKPLDEFLTDALPEDDTAARILRDNLNWLETYSRDQVSGQDYATSARDLLAEAGQALQKQINLDESSKNTLQADLDTLVAGIPQGSHVLPYGPNVALHLLQHKVRQRTQLQHETLIRRIEKATRGLQQLVKIEDEKEGQGEIVGEASRFFNNSSMADVVNHRGKGSVPMESKRLKRVKSIIKALGKFKIEENALHLVTRPGSFSIEDASALTIIESDDPCTKALEIHEQSANGLAKLFASLRTAELELTESYDERFHDSWFAIFDADAFDEAEKQLIPTVIAFESAEHVSTDGMQAFSALLGSGKPVHILINTDPHTNPGQTEDILGGQRLELAYLGIGHRHAVINQVSAAKVESLLSGFSAALGSHQACLHLINTGFTESQSLHPWLLASAALESRAHPYINFDPSQVDDAGGLDFSGNPSPENDWASNPVSYTNAQKELVEEEFAFTFADYCLLKPELLDHFRVVPDGCETEDLVSVDAYLNASAEDQNRLVPHIWAVNEHQQMHKLVVSRRLVFACRDRLNFWQSLQSLAGVRNVHVEEAFRKSREEQQQLAASEREELIKAYEETVQQIQTESTTEVMAKLTNVLVGLDLSSDSLIATSPAPATTSAPPVTAKAETEVTDQPEAVPEVATEEDDDDVSFDEPWIDSIFCTTCDDCLNLNKQMFVYNDNRQAIIADTKAGTFAEMVEAAEMCPARCIHPGKPLDSSEPDLEDLIARAEPFN
ncbi:MAG: ferredoxin [Gammaproteobacteria bacterium]|jgi:ferredoxin|nr:pyruvate decarboxylase [Gammaproteobacteria bacterium]MDP6096619.1 ferredoxin [Gammaproteobacteria bacterium]